MSSPAAKAPEPWSGFERRTLPEGLEVTRPQNASRVAKILVAVFVAFAIAALLAPWVQNIQGSGRVIAYAPEQRQQNIEATISGTIEKWYVEEGSEVNKGDPIVLLADRDGQLMSRLDDQRDAVTNRRSAEAMRVETLRSRVESLRRSRQAQIISAEAQVMISQQDVAAAQQDLAAAEAELETNQLNFEGNPTCATTDWLRSASMNSPISPPANRVPRSLRHAQACAPPRISSRRAEPRSTG